MFLNKDSEAKHMARKKSSDQLSLLALEERDAILFGLHARGVACAKAIDEEVEGRHA